HGHGAGRRRQEEQRADLTEPTVLDPEALQRLMGFGGPKLVRGMVELFLKNAPTKDRKSTRLNSSHVEISYAVFCLKKKKRQAPNSRDKNNQSNKTRKQKSSH